MRVERFRQIADEFAAAIRSGALPAGTRLPTHRDLARERGIAAATATKVYRELAAVGLVVGERGRGTYVRDLSRFGGLEPRRLPTGARVADLSFNQPLAPDQSDQLRHALRALAAQGDLDALLLQQPAGGRSTDRAAVATHLLDRGIDIAPARVLLTAGAQHALDTVLGSIAAPGAVVAVDELTYPGIKHVADARRIELVPIRCDVTGTDAGSLDELCGSRPVSAIYLMPTLHNPLGFTLDAVTRKRIAEIAHRRDCLLVEDGTYGFLAPDAPAPLQRLAPERTFHIGSLSKNLSTGLRVGYVVAPPRHIRVVKRTLIGSSWGISSIVTALATRWIADGTVARLEKTRREDARRRQDIARRHLADLGYHGNPGAYWGWLPLPDELRADIVAHRLAEQGVLVSTADAFAATGHAPNALRLALAGADIGVLPDALGRVREAVRLAWGEDAGVPHDEAYRRVVRRE
ncbi:PLP-dependent aminotransferase family protein [Streptomyces sp. NPDC001292]|uniref:aminotransferase-like domain-containing protein n=1 Tax=Streptomyces sp. NPDC001292 TaxID=3364558 RepID=UPI00367EF864